MCMALQPQLDVRDLGSGGGSSGGWPARLGCQAVLPPDICPQLGHLGELEVEDFLCRLWWYGGEMGWETTIVPTSVTPGPWLC